MRIPVFFNLAKESKQFLVNGVLTNEKASPTLGSGVMFRAFQVRIDKKSKIEFEAGPLVSFLFDNKKSIRFAPILAARFRVMRGENFIMYIGASYSLGNQCVWFVVWNWDCFLKSNFRFYLLDFIAFTIFKVGSFKKWLYSFESDAYIAIFPSLSL
jgi:hypothetical protein